MKTILTIAQPNSDIITFLHSAILSSRKLINTREYLDVNKIEISLPADIENLIPKSIDDKDNGLKEYVKNHLFCISISGRSKYKLCLLPFEIYADISSVIDVVLPILEKDKSPEALEAFNTFFTNWPYTEIYKKFFFPYGKADGLIIYVNVNNITLSDVSAIYSIIKLIDLRKSFRKKPPILIIISDKNRKEIGDYEKERTQYDLEYKEDFRAVYNHIEILEKKKLAKYLGIDLFICNYETIINALTPLARIDKYLA